MATTAETERQRADIEGVVAGKTICHLLERNASENPGDPAMSWKGDDGTWRSMDWREYRDRVAETALGLAELGITRGDTVAIMSSNRPEHIIADQGAVHAGATPTTFYDTLSPEQIEYVATNCEAKVAILENRDYMKRWLEIRDQLDALETIVLMEHADEFEGVLSWDEVVRRGREALDTEPGRFDELWQVVDPGDVATLIYTSGTTGPPKGVIITHHNILFEAEALDRVTGVPDGISGVSYLPLAHIAERLLSIYLPLSKRAHTYFCPDPKQALDYLLEARPSLFFGVPRVWEKVRAAITTKVEVEENDTKRKLAQRALRIGGAVARMEQRGRTPSFFLRVEHAVLDKLVLAKIREGIGLDRCDFTSSAAAPLPVDVAYFFAGIGLPLIEVYGMTETTGVATANRPEAIKIGSVGQALPGVEVRLAEEDNEVLVRGPNNVPGYLELPEATAELIDDEGWIHTGDVGEMDDEGFLRIVDRKKELIITAGGKNLSPANIEALLKEHPLIGQALAYGDEKPFVAALVVLDEEVAPGWAEQRGISDTDLASLAEHPEVQAEVERAVEKTNQRLARVEQVKRFKVLPAEWTAESEELTPTMKLKRRVIHDKYRDEIEGLYTS
jgi:long-chain acyl-CoA synthetase